MIRIALCVAALAIGLTRVDAATMKDRPGWVIVETNKSYLELIERLEAAVKAENMAVVTSASASDGAKAAGISIPGNKVFGVFRNDFARRMLSSSLSAGIEAPVRFYVTETQNGSATLSYKKPSAVFAPYGDEGGDALKAIGSELDGIFAAIAERATSTK